jgi:hypothetical protein
LPEKSKPTSHYKRRQQLIIVNDSGTKQAWKNQTRSFLSKECSAFGKITIINPADKFQLMILKRLSSQANHIILWSEFAPRYKNQKKEVKNKSLKILEDTIKYITDSSFSNSKIFNFSKKIGAIDPAETLFLEIVVTRREILFNNATYTFSDFNFQKWGPIFKKYFNKTILMVTTPNLNKLKKAYPNEIKMLDDFIETDYFYEESKKLTDDFILCSSLSSLQLEPALRFMEDEFFDPILKLKNHRYQPVTETFNMTKYIFSIIMEMPIPIQKILIKSIKLISNGQNYSSVYSIMNLLRRKILYFYKPIDQIIMAKISFPDEEAEIEKGLHLLGTVYKNIQNGIPFMTSELFSFDELMISIIDLLITSNHLNLDKEETGAILNSLIIANADMASKKIRLITEEYQRIKDEY